MLQLWGGKGLAPTLSLFTLCGVALLLHVLKPEPVLASLQKYRWEGIEVP